MQSTLIPKTKQTGRDNLQDNVHRQLRMGLFNVHRLPECDPAYSTQILLWTQDQVVNLHIEKSTWSTTALVDWWDRKQQWTAGQFRFPFMADDNNEW